MSEACSIRRHFILTHGRSGSNFLANTINLHPQLVNFGEVLGYWTPTHRIYKSMRKSGKSGSDYLNYVYQSPAFYYGAQAYSAFSHLRHFQAPRLKRRGALHSLGIKEFVINLGRYDGMPFLASRPEIDVIYLHRDNLLRRYLSGVQLKRSGVAASEKTSKGVGLLQVNLDHLMLHLEAMASETAQDRVILDGLRGNRVLNLRYEDAFLSSSTLSQMAEQVFHFLQVEPITNVSQQKKLLPRRIEEIVANFDEVSGRLQATPFARFLHED
jgi:hypothetical protein